jgi:hypothetical protein
MESSSPVTAQTVSSILIFAAVILLGLAIVLYADGTNTGFVYGNV